MFARIAVINRGEAARRLIHAVRELNSAHVPAGAHAPLRTIALYTESERHAPFVREADLAYCLEYEQAKQVQVPSSAVSDEQLARASACSRIIGRHLRACARSP